MIESTAKLLQKLHHLAHAVEAGDQHVLHEIASALGWTGFEIRRSGRCLGIRVPVKTLEVGDRVWTRPTTRRLGRLATVRSVHVERSKVTVVTTDGTYTLPPSTPVWRRFDAARCQSLPTKAPPGLRVIVGGRNDEIVPPPRRSGHLSLIPASPNQDERIP